MISLTELLTSPCSNKEHLENLEDLLLKANKFRTAYGKPLRVTSGYRSIEDHLRIYKAKGITDKAKIPMKSKHLYGLAVDVVPVEDPIGHLHDWVKDNEGLMVDFGLWFESFDATKTWVHMQILPPASGNRFFIP